MIKSVLYIMLEQNKTKQNKTKSSRDGLNVALAAFKIVLDNTHIEFV